MIDRDIQIAKRLSSRYRGSSGFGREDAYQACVEGFLKAGQPGDEGLVVHVMRNEMHRQSVETSYLMRVPYSTWKKMDETPVQAKHTGLSTETLVQYESPSAAKLDPAFEQLDEWLALTQAMHGLTEKDKSSLLWGLNQWRQGKRPSGKRFYDFNRAAGNLRALLEGDE